MASGTLGMGIVFQVGDEILVHGNCAVAANVNRSIVVTCFHESTSWQPRLTWDMCASTLTGKIYSTFFWDATILCSTISKSTFFS